MSNQDLEVWDTETKRLQDEIDAFLQKFDDIDLLLQRANSEVLYYFQRQTDYTNVDDFKAFLKTELEFYLHTFSMLRAEKRLIRGRIINIEESYNKILYFGEHNPIEERDKKSMPVKPNLFSKQKLLTGINFMQQIFAK